MAGTKCQTFVLGFFKEDKLSRCLGEFPDYIYCALMPCPSTGHKMFGACPNILCRTKKYFAFIATPKNFVLALKLNLIMPCPFTALQIVCAGPTNLIDALYSALSI